MQCTSDGINILHLIGLVTPKGQYAGDCFSHESVKEIMNFQVALQNFVCSFVNHCVHKTAE